MTYRLAPKKAGLDERKLLLAGTAMFVVLGLATVGVVTGGAAVGLGVALILAAIVLTLGNPWVGLIAAISIYVTTPIPVVDLAGVTVPPGRLMMFLLFVGWFAQRRRRDVATPVPRSPLDGAVLFVLVVMIASLVANLTRFSPVEMTGALRRIFLFGVDFALLYFVATSVITTKERVLQITRLIAGLIVLAAFFGIYEKVAGKGLYEYFTPLFGEQVRNFLNDVGEASSLPRAGINRVHSSIGHPIAFGATLLLGLPLAIVCRFLATDRQGVIFWTIGVLMIGASMLFTVSRGVYLIAAISIFILMILVPTQTSRASIASVAVLLVAALFLQADVRNAALSFVGAGDREPPTTIGRTSDYGPVFERVRGKTVLGIRAAHVRARRTAREPTVDRAAQHRARQHVYLSASPRPESSASSRSSG